jgi:hypothetical protein
MLTGILEYWARSEALALYWVLDRNRSIFKILIKMQSDQKKPIHPLFHNSRQKNTHAKTMLSN